MANFADSAEFKKAVADAAAQTVAALLPKLREELMAGLETARQQSGTSGTAQVSGDAAFAESLAMAIAQLTDQGTGRKRVSPEVVRARAEARERMTKLIIEARSLGMVPSYGLRNKVYLDEVLVEPVYITPQREQKQTEIDWPGVPNDAMVPLNDCAKGIFQAYSESVGSSPKEAEGPMRPLSVTAGGLVVKGASAALRPAVALGMEPGGQVEGGEGLRIKGRQQPGKHRDIRVLGTLAPPARIGL